MAKKKINLENADFILNADSPFLMQEDYKALRTNISFSFPQDGCHVIAVASSNKGEGKSTHSINLAISYAQLGKRVLIIDCDMRLPTVASKLNLQNSGNEGLSDVLVGNAEINHTIRKLKTSGVYVLPAGTLPPDPTRLLQSEKMKKLIKALRGAFDYVIIDCPPVLQVIDACLLSESVDGYLLVVRRGAADQKSIATTLNQLKMANAKVLGFVYTNAAHEDKKYYKKYGYGGYSSYGDSKKP